MNKEELDCVKSWNKFVGALDKARKLWSKMQMDLDTKYINKEDLPVKMQQYLGMFRKMQFSVALESMTYFWSTSGGLEKMYVEEPEIEEEEETSNE